MKREVRVFREQGEGSGPRRLGEQLRSEVGGPDRICLGDDGSTPILVAANGEREAEREDQPDHAEQGPLHGAEWLAQRVVVPPQPAAEQDAAGRDLKEQVLDEVRRAGELFRFVASTHSDPQPVRDARHVGHFCGRDGESVRQSVEVIHAKRRLRAVDSETSEGYSHGWESIESAGKLSFRQSAIHPFAASKPSCANGWSKACARERV